MRAVRTTRRIQQPTGDRFRLLVFHRPKDETNGIPTEVPETTVRLQVTVHAYVLSQKILGSPKTELRGNPAQVTDGPFILHHFPNLGQTIAVHEHNPIHELNARPLTGFNHALHLLQRSPAGFFAQQVLPCLSDFQGPLRPQTGGKWQIDGIHVIPGKQLVVSAHGIGLMGKRNLGCASFDEFPGLGLVTTCHSDQFGVFGMGHGLPILLGNSRGPEDSPSAFSIIRHSSG